MNEQILLKNVSKSYKINKSMHKVLSNVNCSIPADCNIGILGANGAGKSTLLRMLGGIEKPSSGTIILPKKSFSWPMALTGGFSASLSGYDNTRFVARIYGLTESRINDVCREVAEFSELGEYFFQPVTSYSSGMKSRLAFSLSISFDFNYYLIDETLSVGDMSFRNKCNSKIKEIREKSHILLVSHDMSTIKLMCDKAIVLHNQSISVFDNVDDAISEYSNLSRRPS